MWYNIGFKNGIRFTTTLIRASIAAINTVTSFGLLVVAFAIATQIPMLVQVAEHFTMRTWLEFQIFSMPNKGSTMYLLPK